MFKQILTLSFSFLFIFGALGSTPILVHSQIEDIYIPTGFDTNDRSELIVTGFLPNLCHKSPESVVSVDKKRINITIKSLKYDESDPFCAPIAVPYVEKVSLGVLDRGEYKITVNSHSPYAKKSIMSIAETSSQAIDDHIYANVDYIEKNELTREITLNGNNPSDCFELESIKFISNNKNTYSILPKLKRLSDFCPYKLVPFRYKAQVPNDLSARKLLLHVRVMDGKSVNTIFLNDLK